ncbi:hypothetical protein TRAPUB_6650 [Trametes pubescens]|uniref:Uncharacterized protein n=1 Tax=Trametes pubescens TaxID=154538 RepID=A0A1M2V5F6_TRAPU|nr:hypothetical protein TRAPUB_6650 [Trametes pubescens]
MPTTTAENARAAPPTTPKRVLAAIHNLPRRMRSGTLRNGGNAQPPPPLPPLPAHAQARAPAKGKENTPPSQDAPSNPPRRRRPAPLLPKSSKYVFGLGMMGLASPRDLDAPSPPPASSARFPLPLPAHEPWAVREGRMVIKVWVPTTDDIWKVRVPAGAGLGEFGAAVAAKIGFQVSFSAVVEGRLRTIGDEDAFRRWVAGRVREGRNTLLTAHRLELL